MAKSPTAPAVQQTISPEERWEEGVEHDERATALLEWLQAYDRKFCSYEHSDMLSSGGDGDPGEALLFLLDEYYAATDGEASI